MIYRVNWISGWYRLTTMILMRRKRWADWKRYRKRARTLEPLPKGISWFLLLFDIEQSLHFGCHTSPIFFFSRKSYVLKNQSNNSALVSFLLIIFFPFLITLILILNWHFDLIFNLNADSYFHFIGHHSCLLFREPTK